MSDTTPALALQPLIHVEDMAASVAFFEALGGTLVTGDRAGDWAQVRIGGAEIGLLAHPPNPAQKTGTVELMFEAHEPLATLEQRLAAAGVTVAQGAHPQEFGEQLQLALPDGTLVKINRYGR